MCSSLKMMKEHFDKICKDLEEDPSEFTLMEQKPYEELAAFMRTKYAKERSAITNDNFQAIILKEGKITKSITKSDCLRKCGNKAYSEGEYIKSMKFYYKALAFAKTKEKRALCYGNISAIFFKTDQIKCCLSAAQKALELWPKNDGYREKMTDRKDQCKAILTIDPPNEYPKRLPLTYPENSRNPEVVKCIEKGPNGGVVTTRDMKFGDVIAVTKSFIKGAKDKFAYINCRNCWTNSSHLDIVPCDNCTFAVYCSNQCKNEDFEFHRLVCERVYWIFCDLTTTELMALNLAFKLLSKGVDIRKEEFQDPKTTCFDWESSSFENQVKAFCSMKNNDLKEIGIKFMKLNSYFLLLDHLKKVNAFKDLISQFENGEELFFKTYWKGLATISVSSVTAECTMGIDKNKDSITHFDLFLGFFNHSCAPNVCPIRSPSSDLIHYVIMEDVKAGEELLISYEGHSFYDATLEERQRYTKMNLGYECRCKACTERWEPVDEFSFSSTVKEISGAIIKKSAENQVLTLEDVELFCSKMKNCSSKEKFMALSCVYKFFLGFTRQDLYTQMK